MDVRSAVQPPQHTGSLRALVMRTFPLLAQFPYLFFDVGTSIVASKLFVLFALEHYNLEPGVQVSVREILHPKLHVSRTYDTSTAPQTGW